MCAVFSQIHHLRVLPPEHQAHTSSSSKDRPTWTAQRHLKPHVSQPRAFTSSTKLFFFQHDLSTWVGSSPSRSPRQECRNVDIIPACPPLLSHHADSLLTHSFIHSRTTTEYNLDMMTKCSCCFHEAESVTKSLLNLPTTFHIDASFCISTPMATVLVWPSSPLPWSLTAIGLSQSPGSPPSHPSPSCCLNDLTCKIKSLVCSKSLLGFSSISYNKKLSDKKST